MPAAQTLHLSEQKRDVGMTFVEMMFAVAVGDTAMQIAKVVRLVDDSSQQIQEAVLSVAPSITHLALVLVVIATSWVGWAHSESTRKYMEELSGIYSYSRPYLLSFQFVMLLVDVFLVVCYFILSEAAELPELDSQKHLTLKPTISQEIFWIMVVLGTYLVWNVLIATHGKRKEQLSFFASQRGWRMLLAVVALLIPVVAHFRQPTTPSVAQALMYDGALLGAILLFRLRLVGNNSALLKSDVIRGFILLFGGLGLIYLAR
jgi:hypothetical protein